MSFMSQALNIQKGFCRHMISLRTFGNCRLMSHRLRGVMSAVAYLVLASFCSAASAVSEIDFEQDIFPILENNCTYCHGEDEQESGLRLDGRAYMLRGGDSGLAAVVPGKPGKSYMIDVINHVDEDMAMPPDDDQLPANEIELISHWIAEGAIWPGQMDAVINEEVDHWSFQDITRPEVPEVNETDSSNPIDAFLLRRLAKESLQYSAAADPRSLIRRITIVLTGLAPTASETDQFVANFAENPDRAYSILVDRLLESPHFGERWAQHWLDVIRWAETNGSESNAYRKNAWIYRDYVIRAFNQDKSYDEFLFEQLAGDTVGQGDATGYLVSGPHVPIATVGRVPSARRQARADRMDEILQTVGATTLGVTIGCARCHNHKFDPISIQDYYAMSAVFQDIEFGGRPPELDADHPRRRRGDELYEEIRELRSTLWKTGPWEENWIGYKDYLFPPVQAKAIRLSFTTGFVRIDELEAFGPENWNENFALADRGTIVTCSDELTNPATPLVKINDGGFGNDAWMARKKPDSKALPWVQFDFPQLQKLNRLRISTNREDYWETDYLEKLNKLMWGPFKLEVQGADGNWKQVFVPYQNERANKKHPERAEILQKIDSLIAQFNDEGPQSSFIGRFIDPVDTFVFGRGSPENPREEVFASALSRLDGDLGVAPDASGPDRRVAFAHWVTSPQNPLTARVAVNRLWHHLFGRGIVATTSDFGAAGAQPTHPELLDWLASEFLNPTVQLGSDDARPWSVKHMIKLIVTTDAFKQSSLPRQKAIAIDGDAALLWRFPPKRVEAEVIRDAILQASGTLSDSVGGRSYRIHNVKKRYAQWEVTDNYGADTWRRMIYQERMRRVDDQMFTAFDFPDCGQVRAKRPVSTTPLQALNLMNSDFVIDQADRIAERAQSESGDGIAAAVDRSFELILTRRPTDDERSACIELAKQSGMSSVCRALINTNEFAFLP